MDSIPEFYPDSDDTYLLIDALELDFGNQVIPKSRDLVSVEVGPGNGLVSKSWLNLCRSRDVQVFHMAIDVNRHAAIETQSQCLEAGLPVDCVLGDMLSFTRSDVKVDVIFAAG